MKIFIIRHGESTSDIENRYGGDHDDHLTEKGNDQARELAQKLSGKGIQIIFSSSRIRAQETANILHDALKCELNIINDLRERNAYGILTGMEIMQAKEEYPNLVAMLGDHKNTVDEAETYDSLLERVEKSFSKIASSSYDTVAIVSHGGWIRCLFRDVLKKGEFKKIGDCAVIELEKKDSNFEIIEIDGAILK